MATNATNRFDAIVGGAGPTGLTMALALSHTFAGDTEIAIVDPAATTAQPCGASSRTNDPRAWALSAASVRLLTALGVWHEVAPDAQAVTEIALTDSALHAGIRPVLLSYDNHTATGEPAAYIVPNGALLRALQTATASRLGRSITVFPGRSISGFSAGPARAAALLDNGEELLAALIIAADGRGSPLRRHAGIKTVSWPYDQLGIVTAVRHERPHGGRAVQHFLPGGPFAILPLPGNASCITWSEPTESAEAIMALDDTAFLAEVQRRFGGRLGLLELVGSRGSFPLAMHLARDFIAPRLALIGDAVHGVHPIAGQGLNLAFRDIAALAECIADGVHSGMSFGDFTTLERYQTLRRFDSTLSATTFDSLNRLFSNDLPLLRSAREVGLGLVDRMPGLKQLFVAEAAGLSGDLPKLMR